jgi:hypothetical protein
MLLRNLTLNTPEQAGGRGSDFWRHPGGNFSKSTGTLEVMLTSLRATCIETIGRLPGLFDKLPRAQGQQPVFELATDTQGQAQTGVLGKSSFR